MIKADLYKCTKNSGAFQDVKGPESERIWLVRVVEGCENALSHVFYFGYTLDKNCTALATTFYVHS